MSNNSNTPAFVLATINADGENVGVMTVTSKEFKTGSKGFFASGKVSINGQLYQTQVQLVLVHSSPDSAAKQAAKEAAKKAAQAEKEQLEAELAQLKAERDAAEAKMRELKAKGKTPANKPAATVTDVPHEGGKVGKMYSRK